MRTAKKNAKPAAQPRAANRLRARAERRLKKTPPQILRLPVRDDQKQLVHELQVHQVELEMQNDELQRVQVELENSRDRLAELYDFAPVANLTLDANGVIHEANLTAAALLGVSRQNLISKKLSQFLHRDSQDAFYLHQQRVFASHHKQACELSLRRMDGTYRTMTLENIASTDGKSGQRRCLAVFTDITEQKRAQAEVVQNISSLPEENPSPSLRISAGGTLLYGNPASADCRAELGWEIGSPVSAEWLGRIREALKAGAVLESEISLGTKTFFCTLAPFAGRGYVNVYARDITQRKQAELAVRQSEERHRALVEATATVVWRTTPEGDVVFATDVWSRITGQTEAQIAGWGWLEAIHPDDRAPTTQKWLHSLETRTVHENEFRVRTRDGDYRWFQVRGVPVFNADGSVREWVGANTDIHERKTAEAALKLSASLMQATVESTTDGLLVVDTSGKITHFNRRFVELWRLPEALPAEHDDERVLKFVLDQLAQPREFLAKVRQLYRAPAVDSFDVIRFKDGRIFERYSRPQWLDDWPVGRVWSFRDVTAREQAVVALRQSEARFRTLAAATFEGIAITENGRFVDCNDQLAELLDCKKKELLGMEVARLIVPEDRARVLANIRAGRESHIDHDILRKDGSRRNLETHGHTITYQGRSVRITAIRDITPRKQAEAALREAHAHLETRVQQRTAELQAANQSLRESELRFSQVVENIEEVFWMTDVAKRQMFFVSAAYEKIWGRPRAKLYASPWRWLPSVHRQDRSRVRQAALTKQASGEYNEVYRVVRPDGTERWIHDRAFPIRDANGTVYRIAGIAEDITERKLAEAERQKFVSLADSSSDFIGLCDRNFRPFYGNAAGLRLVGLDDLEAARRVPVQEFFFPEDQPFITKKFFPRVLREGHGEVEIRFRHFQTGQAIWMLYTVFNIRDASGAVVGWATVSRNITERKEATERLRRSEERLRFAMEVSQMGEWELNLADHTSIRSLRHDLIFGYEKPLGQWTYERFLKHVLPEDRNGMDRQFSRAVKTGEDLNFECRIIRRDRAVRWISVRSKLYPEEQNQARRIVGIVRDITERKLAEAELLDSRHFLRSALDALSAHIGIVDAKGVIVSVNEAWKLFAQTNGLALVDFGVGANYLEFCEHATGDCSAEAAAVAHGIRRVMARRTQEFQMEYPCHSPNEQRWFVVRVTRFEVAGSVRAVVAHENITARKQIEEALRQSQQELADFFEHSPMGLLWVEPNGRISKLNRAQQELFGYRNKDVLGRCVTEFFQETNHVTDRVANGEIVRDQRAKLRQKDGTFKHVLIDAAGRWADGRLIHSHWFVRDITRRVELEREILGISEREQLRMSHDLHDDLGQQLTGIQYLTDTLAGKLEEKSKTGAARAREIAVLVRNAMSQTRELAHGLFPVSMDAEGLADALKQLAARITRVFRRECRFHYPVPVLMLDHTTGIHLYRIAQEAVSNAIRHGKARRIEIALTRTENQLVLKISDEGAGLPRKPKKEKGMGLRIMQYRAGVIGGVLQVQRRTGGGTEVVCTLSNGHLPKHTKRTK